VVGVIGMCHIMSKIKYYKINSDFKFNLRRIIKNILIEKKSLKSKNIDTRVINVMDYDSQSDQ